jgi:hypothetical protein
MRAQRKSGFCIGGPKCGKLITILYGMYAVVPVGSKFGYYLWMPSSKTWLFTWKKP